MCTQVDGLSNGQIKLCQLYQDHMGSVSRGAQLGIRECQWQFKNRRWNCSVIEKDASVFGPVLEIRKSFTLLKDIETLERQVHLFMKAFDVHLIITILENNF